MIAPKRNFTSFQTGIRRLEQAMAGVPDRVPLLAQLHEFAMHMLGINARDFYTTPELCVTGTLEVQEQLGLDIPSLDYDAYNIEAEALGQKVRFHDRYMPDIDRRDPLIKEPADLRKIKRPNFDHDGRFPIVLEMAKLFKQLTGTPPPLQFTAPFSLAANLRGIETLLDDLTFDPEFAQSLLDRLTEEVLAPWIFHLKKHFPEVPAIAGNDATASLPIVSPKLLERWVVPSILRLRELCGPEVRVSNWVGESILKDPSWVLKLKLKVCPDFLEGQDPDVHRIGPEGYKAFAEAHNVPLVLGVGARFMAAGSPQEIRERVRYYLQVGKKNGGFALYLCNLGATTPRENIEAAVQTVHRHGTYPK
jgi:hypothetical protein